MSGGSFDYAYCRAAQFADELQDKLAKEDHGLSPEAIDALTVIAAEARRVAELMRAAEWLLSADYSEETFFRKIEEVIDNDDR